MKPNTTFNVEWWDFNTKIGLRKRTQTLTSNGSGNLVLNVTASSFDGANVTDIAVKIGEYGVIPTPPPTGTSTPTVANSPGDANGDGLVNIADYVIWISHYGQNISGPSNADFDGNGKVDGIDFIIWLKNYTG